MTCRAGAGFLVGGVAVLRLGMISSSSSSSKNSNNKSSIADGLIKIDPNELLRLETALGRARTEPNEVLRLETALGRVKAEHPKDVFLLETVGGRSSKDDLDC